MLNPDTEFNEPSISILTDYLEKNTEISLVGPKLLNTDGSLQTSVWRNPSVLSVFCESFYMTTLLKKKYYKDQSFEEPFEAETFSGAAIFFRKKVLDQIGGLDETMFWIEDVEFCFRAINNGLKCMYLPSTKILHHIGQSAKKNYNISISNQIFNKIKFFKKHHSTLAWLTIIGISFFLVLSKILVFGILSPFNVIYARKARAYLYTFPKMFNPPKGIA